MIRRAVVVLVCAATLLTMAACGSDATPTSRTTATVTVSQSVAAQSAARSGAAPIPTPSRPTSESSVAARAPESSAVSHFGRFRSGNSARSLTARDANVDPADFRNFGGRGYGEFFQSPSGNVKCGIGFADPYTPVGCQAGVSVPSLTGPTCGNDGGHTAYVAELVPGGARSYCTSTSLYVGSDPTVRSANGAPGGRVLQFGQTISVGGVTCNSSEIGIACYRGDSDFTLARDRNAVY